MYDWGIVMVEVVLMLVCVMKRNKFVVLKYFSFEKKFVFKIYIVGLGFEMVEVFWDERG